MAIDVPWKDQRVAYGKMKKAFVSGSVEAFDEAMEKGDNPHYRHPDGLTMLHYVIEHGKNAPAMIERLHAQGVGIDEATLKGATPLHSALMKNDGASLRALLSLGADPNAQLKNGFTAFHQLAASTAPSLPRILFRNGGDPDRPDEKGQSASAHFISRGEGYVIEEFDTWREKQSAPAPELTDGTAMSEVFSEQGTFTREDTTMASWSRLPQALQRARNQRAMPNAQAVANIAANASQQGMLGQVMEVLHEQGLHVDLEAFVTAKGEPTDALRQMGENWDLRHLFAEENLMAQSVAGMSRAYRALPAEAAQQAGNYHQLRYLCEQNRQGERGR